MTAVPEPSPAGPGKPIRADERPHILGNYEAEEMVLALLFEIGESGVDAAVAEGLSPDDFYSVQFGWIYAAMLEVYYAYEDVGYISVIGRLEAHGQLNQLSWGDDKGEVVLNRLLVTPNRYSNSVRACAGEIKDWATRRRMDAQAADLAKAARDRTIAADIQIARHETAMKRIRPFNPNAVFVRGDDSLSTHREMLEQQAATQTWHSVPWLNLAARVPVIMDGDLVVVAGPEGSGKSALLMNWAEFEAKQDTQTVYIHTEMNKTQVFNRRLTANDKRIPWAKLQKPSEMKPDDWATLQDAGATMESWLPRLDYWHAGLIEEHKLMTVMQRMVDDFGTKVFVLDYLNDVVPERGKTDNSASSWRDMLARLEAFSNLNNTVMITAAQLNNEGNAYMIGKALRQKAAVFLKIKPEVLDTEFKFEYDGIPYLYVPGDFKPVMKVAIEKYRGGGRGTANLLYVGPRYLWTDVPAHFDDGHDDPGAYSSRDWQRAAAGDLP